VTSIAAPRWPFATLAARSTLAVPTCPRGEGAGCGGQLCWCFPRLPICPKGPRVPVGGLPRQGASKAVHLLLHSIDPAP
jgi:hypothetical protein